MKLTLSACAEIYFKNALLERFQAELGEITTLFAWPLTFLQWLRGSYLGNWSSYAGCHQIRVVLLLLSSQPYHKAKPHQSL